MVGIDAHDGSGSLLQTRSVVRVGTGLHSTSGASHTVLDAIIMSGADVTDASSWPDNLCQEDASACLFHVKGMRLRPKTLQKRRVVGGSPPFKKLGSRVTYPKDLLLKWADEQAGPIVTSTSQITAA